ncbi:RNA polymerase sigma-70 factor [Pedobacter metabolipauper]|uniref:RNA polymerase sigma-70 factor (ECF subfamily) n=1 Tax=Pedobacter metabolipauper TaxID=425513 RepID=A0A4R6T2F4_9SPHI|nr:RNA polymerase sigma-70 factor [Pedobacter metabolipauper]TDQ11521.1 RNA polymerase sigma-70 factor (ECF subfamily) [Pedobacter metabolipauper]
MNNHTHLPSDEDLIRQLVDGDIAAFDLIYKKYSTALFQAANHLLRNKEVCEDLVHDLFVDLWMRREHHHIKTLKYYLYAAIRNRVLLYIRSAKATVDVSAFEIIENHTAENTLIEKEIRDIVNRELHHLSEKCREIYTLSRMEQRSHKEIADLKGISIKTVENHITIALKRLRPSLKHFLSFLILMASMAG